MVFWNRTADLMQSSINEMLSWLLPAAATEADLHQKHQKLDHITNKPHFLLQNFRCYKWAINELECVLSYPPAALLFI